MESPSLIKNGITYVTARAAAPVAGISADYITKLCRKDDVDAALVGNTWYVNVASLAAFVARKEAAKNEQAVRLAQQQKEQHRQTVERGQQANSAPTSDATSDAAATPLSPAQQHLRDKAERAAAFAEHEAKKRGAQFHSIGIATITLLIATSAGALANEDVRSTFASHLPHQLVAVATAAPSHAASFIASRAQFTDIDSLHTSSSYAQLAQAQQSFPQRFTHKIRTTFCRYLSLGCDATERAQTQPQQLPTAQVFPAQQSATTSRELQKTASDSTQPLITRSATTAKSASPTSVPQQPRSDATHSAVTSPTRSPTGITETLLDARIKALQILFNARLSALANAHSYQTIRTIENLADATRIDSLSSSAITGTVTNVIDSASATIASLTANTLVATNASTTSLTVSATTTTSGLVIGSLDCSSLGNGGTLTTNPNGTVVCATDDGGSGATVAGSDTQIQFNNAGAFGASSAFTFASLSQRLAVPFASTTALSATSLCLSSDCRSGWPVDTSFATTSADYWKSERNFFSTSSADHWGSTKGYATFGYPFPFNATSTLLSFNGGLLAVGSTTINGNATTTGMLGVGSLYINSERFTDLTGSGLTNSGGLLSLDATGNWTGTFDGLEGAAYLATSFSTTSANHWQTTRDFFSTTSASHFASLGLAFSTTSADAWKNARNFFATTSADYWETQQTARTEDDLSNNSIEDLIDVAAISENYGDLFAWNGAAWVDFATSSLAIALADTTGTLGATRGGTGISSVSAAGILVGNYAGTGWQQLATSTLGILTTHVAEGSNLYFTDARVQTYLDTVGKGFFFSTSSASYFLAQNQGNAFSTTSADAWKDNRNFFSTSSATHFASVGLAFSTTSNDYWKSVSNFFSTTSAQHFVHASTTIPKTYSANSFTALQTFINASSTLFSSTYASTTNFFGAGLALCQNNNVLTWSNGLFGCEADDAGSGGAYPFPLAGNATSTLTQFNGGITAFASSTIGNGTASGGLMISGNATTSGNVLVLGSTSLQQFTFLNATGTNATTTNLRSSVFSLGSLNGPLHANGGLVSATSSIGVLYGGTGLTGAPSYGQLLLGNTSGGYSLSATSSLGLQSVLQGAQGQVTYFSGTNTAVGTSSLFIATSGNVGIGTTSPSSALDVVSSSGRMRVNDSDATGISDVTSGIEFYRNGATRSGFALMSSGGLLLGTDEPEGFLSFKTGDNVDAVRVDSSGNVGIGTTTPVEKLSILSGDNTASTNIFAVRANNLTQGIGVGYNTIRSLGTNQALTLDTNGTGSLTLQTGGASRLTVDGTTGNVGIGTTTPSTALVVQGTGAGGVGHFLINSTGSTVEQSLSVNGTRKINIGSDGSGNFYLGNQTTADTQFFVNTGSIQAMTIKSSGNVGIGTTTPDRKLQLYGTGNTYGSIVVNATSLDAAWESRDGTSSVYSGLLANTGCGAGSWSVYNGGCRLVVNSSGNVGIGTTTMDWLNEEIVIQNTSGSTDTMIGFGLGASGIKLGLNSARGGFAIESPDQLTTYFLLSTSTGNVGIGTSTIQGENKLTLGPTGGAEEGGQIAFLPAVSFSTSWSWDNYRGDFRALRGDGTGASNLTAMLIASSTGNVGIATTSPWRTLSVVGTAAIDGLTSSATGNYVCINTTTWQLTRGNGSACTTSSARFKDDIADLDYGLNEVVAMRAVSFRYKPEMNMGTSKHVGFIAEEMQLLVPEVVNIDETGRPSGIDYPSLTAVLAKAIAELAGKVSETAHLVIATVTAALGSFDRVQTNELCVGSVCVTESQFLTVFGATPIGTTIPIGASPTDASPTDASQSPPVAQQNQAAAAAIPTSATSSSSTPATASPQNPSATTTSETVQTVGSSATSSPQPDDQLTDSAQLPHANDTEIAPATTTREAAPEPDPASEQEPVKSAEANVEPANDNPTPSTADAI